MKKYYFQFLHDVDVLSTYSHRVWKAGNYVSGRGPSSISSAITTSALRIWCESQNEVFYVKHHYPTGNVVPRVDMEEFFWIKLSARKLETSYE